MGTKLESISPDGSWKIVVEAWSTSAVIYSAIGVTTRVYTRGTRTWWDRLWNLPAGWDPATDSASADCRAWNFGGTVQWPDSGGFAGTGLSGEGVSSLKPIADMIRDGSGTATRFGLQLRAGPVGYPI
jgi:hypothetical protein